jgi:hypothetical protein
MIETDARPFEERMIELTDWFKKVGEVDIANNEKVPNIDQQFVKRILGELEANIEISDKAKTSLAMYSNYDKRPGLNEVWGKRRVIAYIRWAKYDFTPKYEQRIGREFPGLYDRKTNTYDNLKYSGMLQFLGELTAFGEGIMPLEEYKRLTKVRIDKGIKFENLKPEDDYKPSPHSFYPPEFPSQALTFLIHTKSVL